MKHHTLVKLMLVYALVLPVGCGDDGNPAAQGIDAATAVQPGAAAAGAGSSGGASGSGGAGASGAATAPGTGATPGTGPKGGAVCPRLTWLRRQGDRSRRTVRLFLLS
jgi:hypothetical protein